MNIRHEGLISTERNLPGGSPQGGLLSLILFCLYTNFSGIVTSQNFDELTISVNNIYRQEMTPMIHNDTIRLKYVDDLTIAEGISLTDQVKKAARDMNRKAFAERLREIRMSEYDAQVN